MNHRLFIALFCLQAILVYFAYPNILVYQPSLIAVVAIVLALIPFFFFAIRYQKNKAFVLGGMAGAILIMVPSLVITQGDHYPIYYWFVWLMTGVLSFFFYGLMVWLISVITHINRSLFVFVTATLFTTFESIRLLWAEYWSLTELGNISPTLALAGWPPLVQMVSITGSSGPIFFVSLIAAWLVMVLYEKILQSERGREWFHIRLKVHPLSVKKYHHSIISSGLLTLMMCAFLVWGNIEAKQISNLQNEEEMTIRPALVQTNFDVAGELVWNRHTEYRAIREIRNLAYAAAAEEADFIQFSNNVLPGYLPHSAKLWTDLQSVLAEVNLPAIIGILSILDDEKQFNSWFYLDRQGKMANYYVKRHLRPMFDYLPLTTILDGIGKLSKQKINRSILAAPPAIKKQMAKRSVAGVENRLFNIYGSNIVVKADEEILIASQVRDAVRDGGELIMAPGSIHHHNNKTNYFMNLLITRIRAIETRRWIGSVASMGGAVYIDALGKIRAKSTFNQKQVLIKEVPLLTYKSIYVKVGELFRLIVCIMALGLVVGSGYHVYRLNQQRG